jgi:signal transduction histidine kinase
MKSWRQLMERLPKPESRSQFIVAVVLLLLLPLLAAMQYRWLGQVGAGEREQMKANLHAAAKRFSQDFDREINRVYAAFISDRMLGPFSSGDQKQNVTAASYHRWLESSSKPRLIKAVYETKLDDDGRLHLERLKFDSGQFEPCQWLQEMTTLRQHLEQHEAFVRSQMTSPALSSSHRIRPRPMQPLNAEIPALIYPLMEYPRINNKREFSFPLPSGFVIIALDLSYIQQVLLPALVKQHFVESDRQNYDMAIVARTAEQQVIWQSVAADSAVKGRWIYSKSDASSRLFTIQTEEIINQLRDRRQRMEPTELGSKRRRKMTVVRRPGNGVPPPIQPFSRMILGRSGNEQQGIWDLHLRHRTGSLETAVAGMRHRDLIISFTILLMLAASFLLMMISSLRARRLAQQQMDFVAGISHELRTPLAVIDSAGYNLTKGFIHDPEAMKEYGSLIRTHCSRLKEMIEQVLEFTSMRSGRQKYDLHPVKLDEVIDEALAASQPLLGEGEFRVEKEIPAKLPEVTADRKALVRALQNLLSNAMKYGGEDRWIGIKASVADNAGAEVVNIGISDRGAGIAAEDLRHVFEAFYRGSEVRAAQIQGNGLGLSLVKEIVEAHGGWVSVMSEPGKGSAFTVSIPSLSGESTMESTGEQKQEIEQ